MKKHPSAFHTQCRFILVFFLLFHGLFLKTKLSQFRTFSLCLCGCRCARARPPTKSFPLSTVELEEPLGELTKSPQTLLSFGRQQNYDTTNIYVETSEFRNLFSGVQKLTRTNLNEQSLKKIFYFRTIF